MKKIIFITVVCAFVTGTAMADLGTITVKYNGMTYGEADYAYGGGLNNSYGYSGLLSFTPLSGTGMGNNWLSTNPLYAFCIELPQSISGGGTYTYSVLDLADAPLPAVPASGVPMGSAKADYIRELWAEHYADVVNNVTAAAFQLAIWEIVYENSGTWDVTAWDGTQDSFKVTGYLSGVDTLANSWLAGVADVGGSMANLYALSSNSYQDIIVEVPVPAAFILGMLGLSAAGIKLRKYA
jgi:hypothetical protein